MLRHFYFSSNESTQLASGVSIDLKILTDSSGLLQYLKLKF